jgi:hypothetical protein
MLFFIAAPLAEILSGNIPLLKFISPGTLIGVTLFYGLPVVLIRDLAVARRLNVVGIVVLGLGYGILNEGVLAKTLTTAGTEAIGPFSGYGQLGLFQGSQAIFIVFWHALHSVLYPILITHWTYPAAARSRWVTTRGLWIMLPLLGAIYALHFIWLDRPARPAYFVAYLLATALLILLAVALCRQRQAAPAVAGRASLKPMVFGLAAVFFYILQYVLAANRVLPFSIYAMVVIGITALGACLMALARWRAVPQVLLFGLGDDLTFSLLAGLVAMMNHNATLQHALAAAGFFVLFVWLIHKVRRAPDGRGTGAISAMTIDPRPEPLGSAQPGIIAETAE